MVLCLPMRQASIKSTSRLPIALMVWLYIARRICAVVLEAWTNGMCLHGLQPEGGSSWSTNKSQIWQLCLFGRSHSFVILAFLQLNCGILSRFASVEDTGSSVRWRPRGLKGTNCFQGKQRTFQLQKPGMERTRRGFCVDLSFPH